ncbi:MAG: hypothetical protein P8M11_08845 [Planctomycetota bacterium]|nr:hypothetical protein [Planctomycetota bacterium]
MQRPLSPLPLAALLLALAPACDNVHIGSTAPGPDAFVELEPNDTPSMADFIAVTDALTCLTVEGHVQAIGFDVVDHLEFEACEPMELRFYLEAHAPFGDVDVSIYDPIDHVILGTYASGGPTEVGTLLIHEAGRPFQFVIDAFVEDTTWCLQIEGFPAAFGLTAPEEGGDRSQIQGARSNSSLAPRVFLETDAPPSTLPNQEAPPGSES